MALRKALWLPNTSYAPEDDRLGLSALWYPSGSTTNPLSVRSGVVRKQLVNGYGPLQVYAATGLNVNIAPGQMVYQGANTANQGAYIITNDSAATVGPFATADPNFARIDVVYVLVSDTSENDATNNTQPLIAKGAPASAPAAPAIPAGAFALANVTVRAGATVILGTDITDVRVYTTVHGVPLPVSSTLRPANPYMYQRCFDTDTMVDRIWDGSTWRMLTPYRQIIQLSAAQPEVTFPSIPPTLKLVKVTYSARSTGAGTTALYMRANGVTTNSYAFLARQLQNATQNITNFPSIDSAQAGAINGANSVGFSTGVVEIAGWNLTSGATDKFTYYAHSATYGTQADSLLCETAGSAVIPPPWTSLTFRAGVGNLAANCMFILEGWE